MPKPRAQTVTGIVFHGAQFSRHSKRIGHAFGSTLVIGGKAYTNMTVVEDRIVLPISLFDLIEALCDQEAFQSVSRHERERALKKIEPAQCRKFIEHQQ